MGTSIFSSGPRNQPLSWAGPQVTQPELIEPKGPSHAPLFYGPESYSPGKEGHWMSHREAGHAESRKHNLGHHSALFSTPLVLLSLSTCIFMVSRWDMVSG